MKPYLALVAFIVMPLSSVTADDPAEELGKPAPELRVLEGFIGSWNEEMSNKATEWTPNARKITAVTKRVWFLGGKYIRGEGAWMPDNNQFFHLMSYDPQAKAYRAWYFDASGTMPSGLVKGEWDARTKTLKWTDRDEAGNKTVGWHKVVDKDHTEWAMSVTNPAGKVVLDLSGKCTRRKE
jgi:hypothetical protein